MVVHGQGDALRTAGVRSSGVGLCASFMGRFGYRSDVSIGQLEVGLALQRVAVGPAVARRIVRSGAGDGVGSQS